MVTSQNVSMRAISPIWASEASLARTRERASGEAPRLRVLARLISLAQIGELARRLQNVGCFHRLEHELNKIYEARDYCVAF